MGNVWIKKIVWLVIIICVFGFSGAKLVFASIDDLSNHFDNDQCIYTAFERAPVEIKRLINWTQKTAFTNYPSPPNWVSWYAAQWPTNIATYGPQLDPKLDWQSAVDTTPEVGALVVWAGGSTTHFKMVAANGKKVDAKYTFSSAGHIGVVKSYDAAAGTVVVLERNWGTPRTEEKERIDVLVESGMTFIHIPQPFPPARPSTPTLEVMNSQFNATIPLRNLLVTSSSKFDLIIDGKTILQAERPERRRSFSKTHVLLGLNTTHKVEIRWWKQEGDVEPDFIQTWWPNEFVFAADAEPDANTGVQVTYTVNTNSSSIKAGQDLKITIAAVPKLNLKITKIKVMVDGKEFGNISGSVGTITWNTQNTSAGTHQITYQASLQNWDGKVANGSTDITVQSQSQPVSTGSNSNSPGPWDVSWAQNISRETLVQRVNNEIKSRQPSSGLMGQGNSIVAYSFDSINGNPAGVNPAFALAMFLKEAEYAKPGSLAYKNNNPGNITCGSSGHGLYGAVSCNGRFSVYSSMAEGVKAYFWLLQYEYKPGGSHNCSDISCIIRVYAPSSENNTQLYIQQVTQWTEEIQNSLLKDSDTISPDVTQTPSKTPVQNKAPAAPILNQPSNNGKFARSTSIDFSWNKPSEATQYYLEYWGGPYNTLNSGWIEERTYHVGQMWPGDYSWHVKAKNAAGESAWSDTWILKITVNATDIPSGSTSTPVTPTSTQVTDTTKPDGDYTSPSSGQNAQCTVHLAAWASDSSSGVKEVHFTGKVNGTWRLIYSDSNNPYEYDWNMCEAGVPDGDIELGLDVFDNAGNEFNLSTKHTNVHINKSSPTQIPTSSPPPTNTPAPQQPGTVDLVDDLVLRADPSNSWPPPSGNKLIGHIHIRNNGDQVVHIEYIGIRGRRNGSESWDIGFSTIDLGGHSDWTLEPNNERPLQPGNYSFRISYSLDGSNWTEIGNQINFTVK